MINKVFNKLRILYQKSFWSVEKQARRAGVVMGEHNFIDSCFWRNSEPYLIKIGSHCALTEGVRLFTHGGARVARNLYPKFDVFGKVSIGDYVYLGANCMVMPGVTIGNNVLVASGSVVTKSVPSNVVIAGNPARIVCTVDEYIGRNMSFNTNTKGMEKKEKRKLLLSLDDDKFVQKNLMK